MTLYFKENNTFKILQMTDLHYHHGNKHQDDDELTITLLEQLVDIEKPDFVMFTGDILIAYEKTDVTDGLDALLKGVTKHNIPWAYVFGNHDHEKGISKEIFIKTQQSIPNCYTVAGPNNISGMGNFVLDIKDKNSNEIGARLFCLDSHDYPKTDQGKYAWIDESQIKWFQEQTASNIPKIPSFVFFHIPLPEYNDAWESTNKIGSKNEKVCCPEVNSHFFDAMVDSQHVLACFVGHDHINDFCAAYRGIDLNYGRMGGHHTYGKEGFLKGGKIIEITKNQWTYKVWCRLKDNSIVNEALRDPKQTLNLSR